MPGLAIVVSTSILCFPDAIFPSLLAVYRSINFGAEPAVSQGSSGPKVQANQPSWSMPRLPFS